MMLNKSSSPKTLCQKRLWTFFKLVIIFLLALRLLSLFDLGEKEKTINEVNTTIQLDEQNSFQQEYPLIKTEAAELVLSKLLERYRYDQLCFVDEGTVILEEAISDSRLLINVTYNNQSKLLANGTTKCFELGGESNLRWNVTFVASNELIQNYLNVKDFRGFMVVPHVSIYLKRDPWYPLYVFLLTLFYSGIFLAALNGIYHFIRGPPIK